MNRQNEIISAASHIRSLANTILNYSTFTLVIVTKDNEILDGHHHSVSQFSMLDFTGQKN